MFEAEPAPQAVHVAAPGAEPDPAGPPLEDMRRWDPALADKRGACARCSGCGTVHLACALWRSCALAGACRLTSCHVLSGLQRGASG